MTVLIPKHPKATWSAVRRLWWSRIHRRRLAIALSIAIPLLTFGSCAAALYRHYAQITDAQLRIGAFQNATDVYAAPLVITEGDSFSTGDLSNLLEQGGFTESSSGNAGTFRVSKDTAEIFAGVSASATKVRLSIAEGKRISKIEVNGVRNASWAAGTPLLATLSSSVSGSKADREKRHMVTFAEIPQVLVDAVTTLRTPRR